MNEANRPFISVIVPFRDAGRWLRLCLESLVNQEFDSNRYEIIAVDNNSRDDSAAVARSFPRVRLLHEPRNGAYAARNLGIKHARGEIIAFTDADCVPVPGWLHSIAETLADPQTLIVLGRRAPDPGSALLSLWSAYENAREEFVFSGSVPDLYYGHTNNMAAMREVFEDLGPFVTLERGSDTVLVRATVDKSGCGSVVYRSDMQVSHLEMVGMSSLLRKLYIYGRSSVAYGRVIRVSSLDLPQRWSVFRRAVANKKYSLLPAASLLYVLTVGILFWWAGTRSARAVAAASDRPRMPRSSEA